MALENRKAKPQGGAQGNGQKGENFTFPCSHNKTWMGHLIDKDKAKKRVPSPLKAPRNDEKLDGGLGCKPRGGLDFVSVKIGS